MTREMDYPEFENKAIEEFYWCIVLTTRYAKGTTLAVITKLLHLIDQYGHCPSVVKSHSHYSIDSKRTQNEFDLLAKVTLAEHLLLVAEINVRNTEGLILKPDGIITGLAHDIGKIPIFHVRGYATGDHPIMSVHVLNSIEGYRSLPQFKEINNAILAHHNRKPPNRITKLLVDADSEAREAELSRMYKIASKMPSFKDAWSKQSKEASHSNLSEKPEHIIGAAIDGGHGLRGEIYKYDRYWPKITNVTQWFDADCVLREILKTVNLVVDGRWGSISMPNGMIYCSDREFFLALQRSAPENIELMIAPGFEDKRQDIVYSCVWELSRQRNAVATEQLKTGYYTSLFILSSPGKSQNIDTKPIPLIPLYTAAFDVLPSSLENKKSIAIKKVVGSVTPFRT